MLKLKYDSLDQVPAKYLDLYEIKDGVYLLTGVELPPSKEADVQRLQTALTKERSDHSSTKEKLKPFENIDPATVQASLDELEELRIKVDGLKDTDVEGKVQKLVDSKVERIKATYEREKQQLTTKLSTYEQQVADLSGTITKTKINGALMKAAQENKIVPTAMEDILLHSSMFEVSESGDIISKESKLDVNVWLQDMKDKRPHWWPASVGGGASGSNSNGGGSNNPWSKASWNLTEQGRILREQGADKAGQLAKLAGVDVYASKPAS
jgi:hypothetical protein